jgi:hypothetical protein
MMRSSLFVMLGMLLPGAALASFSDVPASHQSAQAIAYVQEQGFVIGYSDGTYQPDASINRAEFVKILRGVRRKRIAERETLNPAGPKWEDGYCITVFGSDGIALPFSDVQKNAWFAPDVCFAVSQGLVDGYPDGTFRPANSVNFAEAAKIIVNTFEISVQNDPQEWYKPYVEALALHHAIPSSIRYTDSFITRGEMAEMIYHMELSLKHPDVVASSSAKSGTVEIISPAGGEASSARSVPTPGLVVPLSSSAASSSVKADLWMYAERPDEATPVRKGESIPLSYVITNDGPGAAHAISLNMVLSYKSDFDVAKSDPRCHTNNSSIYNVICDLGTIEPGANTTARYLCPNTLTFDASTDTDDDPSNARASIVVPLICPPSEEADVWVESVSSYLPMQAGSMQTMSFYLHNDGPAMANAATLRVSVPAGLSFITTGSSPTCSLQNGEVFCQVGTILAHSESLQEIKFLASCPSATLQVIATPFTTTQTPYPLHALATSVDVECPGQ